MYGVEIRPRRAASAAPATIPIVIATGNEATNLMPVDAKPAPTPYEHDDDPDAAAHHADPDHPLATAEIAAQAVQPVERSNDPSSQQERSDERGDRRCNRQRDDLHVVVHAEHHPARAEHDRERQRRCKQREGGDLEAQRHARTR